MENGNGSSAPALSPETRLVLSHDTQGLFTLSEKAAGHPLADAQAPAAWSHKSLSLRLYCFRNNYMIGYGMYHRGLCELQSSALEQLGSVELSAVTKMVYKSAVSDTVATNHMWPWSTWNV